MGLRSEGSHPIDAAVGLFGRGVVLAGRQTWFRDVDSNHDTQLQRLMSYRLDDPGIGTISVAEAPKAPKRHRSRDFPQVLSRPRSLLASVALRVHPKK